MSTSLTTVLSQDIVMTNTIPVEAQSPSPTAPFAHPSNGAVEALVIANGILGHVTRDTSADAGWRLDTIGGGDGIPAAEVAAGTAYAGTPEAAVYGLYQDTSALHFLRYGQDGWSAPNQIVARVHSHLRPAYSPAGRLVSYAITSDGDLAIAYQPTIGAPFAVQTYAMTTPLADGNFALCLTDERSWQMAAEVNGQLWIYTGVIDGTSTTPSSAGPATNYTGSIEQVVFGYWSNAESAIMFVFVDGDGVLQTWSSTGVTPVVGSKTLGKVTKAAGHVYVDPETGLDSIHIYTVNDNQHLSVLHQNTDNPWQDGKPVWSVAVPLDTQIASVAIDANPTEVPALFGMSSDNFSLRLHTQDPATRMWRTGHVLQKGEKAFEVTRFRAEVTFYDDQGKPLANQPVIMTLAEGSTGTDVTVAGTTYPMTTHSQAKLTTTAQGKITMSILVTTGLAAPQLVLDADGKERVTVQPASGVHNYLAGNGTLNPTNPPNPAKGAGPLPQFAADGSALRSATVNGGTLATNGGNSDLVKAAASAIQQTSMVGTGTTPTGIAGYHANLTTAAPRFVIFASQTELQAHLEASAGVEAGLGSIWDGIENFFSDVWEGIKNGVIKIADFVVDAAKKVVNFTLQVADEIKKGVQLALKGIEQAAHFISGVFQAIGAALEKVIDWLKALFDFGAIWRTKISMQQIILGVPLYIKDIAQLGGELADGWFAKQENYVREQFTKVQAKYEGQSFGHQQGYQGPGAPDSSTKVAGAATPADFTNNVHHNWLNDKVNATAGDSSLGITDNSKLQTPAEAFQSNVSGAISDFSAATKDLAKSLQTLIQDPESFATTGMSEFLKAVEEIIEGGLKACDGMIDGFLALVDDVMDALIDVFNTRIDIPILAAVWAWLAEQAGYPEDSEFTVAALGALVGAFPTTVIYKLIAGVDREPFPDARPDMALALTGDSNPWNLPFLKPTPGFVLAGAVLQTAYTVIAVSSDLLGPQGDTTILGVLGLILSIVIWGLMNGFPDLRDEDWGEPVAIFFGLLLGFTIALFVCKGLATALKKFAAMPLFSNIVNGVLTVYGFGRMIVTLVMAIVADEKGVKLPVLQTLGGFFCALPSAVSFCNLSTFQDDPEVKPFATAAKVVFDLVGYVGGGLMLVIDATLKLESDAATAVAL